MLMFYKLCVHRGNTAMEKRGGLIRMESQGWRQTYNMETLLWEGMTSAEPEAVDRQIKPSDIYTGANEGNVQTKKLTACCML